MLKRHAAQVEQKIREVTARPGIGGDPPVAAALPNEAITVYHMKVKRVLAMKPPGVS